MKILMKLGEYEETVNVPREIRGIKNIAHFICDKMARKFTQSYTNPDPRDTYERRLADNYTSWYTGHYPHIETNLRERLETAKARMGLK